MVLPEYFEQAVGLVKDMCSACEAVSVLCATAACRILRHAYFIFAECV